MKLSVYIILSILFISTVFYEIQFTEARQLRKTDDQDHDDHHFTVGYTDDFGPTSPGNSPGIGHKMKENEENAEGYKDDFEPTTPGHSPGVGHAVKNNEPNA
ncbi:Precursor of CEP6 [Arabidopsis thaliana]|uniref:Uncharacterized protein n=3 Tax=Arabidopsis TaxID=3701 RepID=A0A178UBH8_ARATH|nr:hypothetical protein ISN45_At05g063370 [Arabidopsis thaliana x Arabidopsis arenosa]KAG7614479.1 hypothetical protein ISN44_As05g062620 [Arabidopsis suecica]OAO90462.1 hypothetical protein AXX17_AT5G66830 [Arabidopsis thaliana]CAA0412543.1 unnamed protein product [Arabidopsis thaliana]VYS71643.1 unnamed protein product [Arabidopsis thaliana]